MLLADFGPIAGLLTDPRGLGETGEVLVGVANGDTIRLILPPRLRSPVAEVASSELPSLSAAARGADSASCARPIIAARTSWWPTGRWVRSIPAGG